MSHTLADQALSPISAMSNNSLSSLIETRSNDADAPKSSSVKTCEIMSRKKFKEEKADSEHEWNTLPDSVIGTLIYFLLVEHDSVHFNICETVWILILVGFPVYFTYLIQIIILYQLWSSLPSLGDPISSGFCTNDYQLNLVALAFFFVQVLHI
jgi:hypothetical protein